MPGTRKDLDPLSSLVSKPEASRPEPPRAPTPAELAKILAKAAMAKAAASRPAAPAPAAPAAAAAPARLQGIAGAPPPRKAMSAADAMEAARQSEEHAVQTRAAAPRPEPVATPAGPGPTADPTTRPQPTARTALTDPVQAILAAALPGNTLFVAGAYTADDRRILTALWKAHRANFGARSQLDLAVACANVLSALQTVPAQRLVAAHVLSDKADYLLWLDVQNRTLIAAFPNARALIAGLEGA